MWNEETVARLNTWYKSLQGSFALEQEHRLFQHLVSRWPRRGRTLLDIGCSPGVFLRMFWDYGFDVTGLDISEPLLSEAREYLGNKADFRLGQLDHLPLDAGDFDYAALLSVLEYIDCPKEVLAEAMRVARRGVVVGFINSWSLYHIANTLPCCAVRRKGRWLNVWQIIHMARDICPSCRISIQSALFGSPGTWKEKKYFSWLNKGILPLPFGAYIGVRIDTEAQIPLTPLFLKSEEDSLAAI